MRGAPRISNAEERGGDTEGARGGFPPTASAASTQSRHVHPWILPKWRPAPLVAPQANALGQLAWQCLRPAAPRCSQQQGAVAAELPEAQRPQAKPLVSRLLHHAAEVVANGQHRREGAATPLAKISGPTRPETRPSKFASQAAKMLCWAAVCRCNESFNNSC